MGFHLHLESACTCPFGSWFDGSSNEYPIKIAALVSLSKLE